MNYKTSQFNISIPVDNSDEVILFNTKECSFVVLDEENQSFLKDINEINTYEEDIVSNLTELGFLVDKDLNEINYIKHQTKEARLHNESLSITIATTLDCNMNCYYCFEQKNKTYMTTKDADKIISFITNRLSEGQFKKLLIIWTGGEPLLNKDIIEYISKPLIKYCVDKDLEYRASTITNGLLLTEDTAKFLEEMKVREIQVTIDGLENTHNKRRLSLDKYNSFQTILSNVNTACKYLFIVIRINIDRNNQKEIKELINYLYNTLDYKNNDKVSFSLAQVNECKSSLSLEEYLSFYRDIYDDYIINGKLDKYYPTPLSFACGAQCKDSYVIGPEGLVYKCWEQVGMEECSIGTVEKVHDDCEQNKRYLTGLWPKECEDCSYIPMCHGGCPKAREKNNNRPICNPQTKTLDKYLKRYYEMWKASNE